MRLLQNRVCQPWTPHLALNGHATNGSIHRFALTDDIPRTEHSGRHEPAAYLRGRMVLAVQAAERWVFYLHDAFIAFRRGLFHVETDWDDRRGCDDS